MATATKVKKTPGKDAKIVSVKNKTIKLSEIVANTAQSRGMGVLTKLTDMGYGLFEKAAVDGKEPLWDMLTSDKPEDQAHACMLLEENEPELITLAESCRKAQLQPIGIWGVPEDKEFDVIYGMRRALALAFNHAKHADPDTIEVKLFEFDGDPNKAQLQLIAHEENRNRKSESTMDRALLYRDLEKQGYTKESIAKLTNQSAMNITRYSKVFSKHLNDTERMKIHAGTLTLEQALKMVEQRKTGSNGKQRVKDNEHRFRMPGTKAAIKVLAAAVKPKKMTEQEWSYWIEPKVREFVAFCVGVEYKPYVEPVMPEEKEEDKPKGKALQVRRGRAIKLLVSLGKTTAASWSDDLLKEKLEDIVNIVEEGQEAETPALNKLLDRLKAQYAKGLIVSIVEDEAE